MLEDKDEVLSPEEREVDEMLAAYNVEIASIEKQMDAIKDPKRTPEYTPGFFRGAFTPKDETRLGLETKKAELTKQAKGRAAEIADKCPPALQGKLYEKTDAWRQTPKEGNEKNLDESSGFLSRLRERSKFIKEQKEFDATKERVGTPFTENKQQSTFKIPDYYSHLRFNDTDNIKTPDVDKEASTPEPDRED